MNGRRDKGGAYRSPRPAPEGSLVKRLPDSAIRGIGIVNRCDTSELQYFLSSVIGMGYCCAFTCTSDGGAVSITVYDGAIRFKSYARHEDELPSCYRDLLAAIRGEE